MIIIYVLRHATLTINSALVLLLLCQYRLPILFLMSGATYVLLNNFFFKVLQFRFYNFSIPFSQFCKFRFFPLYSVFKIYQSILLNFILQKQFGSGFFLFNFKLP